MGSTYFRDFHLVHRRLRIEEMVSIEGDKGAAKRIEFNRPLSCISLLMKPTSEALPLLDFGESPDFIWLDYESRVDAGVLADVDEVISNCAPLSVFAISANAERMDGEKLEEWLADAELDTRSLKLPGTRKEFARLTYDILKARIDQAIYGRNSAQSAVDIVQFHQLLHVVYADNVQMITVAGILLRSARADLLQRCRLGDLEFLRDGIEPFNITVPRLTRREVHYLLKHFPEGGDKARRAAFDIGIPQREVTLFEALYRYAPLFVEVDDW